MFNWLRNVFTPKHESASKQEHGSVLLNLKPMKRWDEVPKDGTHKVITFLRDTQPSSSAVVIRSTDGAMFLVTQTPKEYQKIGAKF